MKKTINYLEEELRKQGFAGKTDIPKIIYLAATTRLFKNPVSCAVFGPSGVGKSYSVESGLQFIPPAEIEPLSGMSEKALPYLGSEMSLKHRVLFLGEAAGMADGNGRAFLRQLLTEGKIDYLTVQKTGKGLSGEKLPTVEGPVCFIMTTTANRIHHEDQSRMLILNIDYDRENLRQALLNSALGKTKSRVEIDLAPWHELQEKIASGPKEVVIPYAESLAQMMPIENIKVQRDFPKILSMIQACALVHQESRDRNELGEVIADREDYVIIYDLLNVPLSQGLESDVTPGVRLVIEGLENIINNNMKEGYEGISQSKLAEVLKTDRSSVLRNTHSAIDLGYIYNLNPGKGKEARLILGERKLSSKEALPHPDKLFDGISPEQVHRCTTERPVDAVIVEAPSIDPWGDANEWLIDEPQPKSTELMDEIPW